jgi:hypothetical protein
MGILCHLALSLFQLLSSRSIDRERYAESVAECSRTMSRRRRVSGSPGLLGNVGFNWFVSVTAQRSKVSLKYRIIMKSKGGSRKHKMKPALIQWIPTCIVMRKVLMRAAK